MNDSLNAALPCCKDSNCFAYWDGKCSALTQTKFSGKCPFFKDREEKALEDIRCKERADKWKAAKDAKQKRLITL